MLDEIESEVANGLGFQYAKWRKYVCDYDEDLCVQRLETREEGYEHGFEEDLEQGREEVLEEGREEGRMEGQKEATYDYAIRMHNEGIPDDLIMKVTGLEEKTLRYLFLKRPQPGLLLI